MLPSLFHFYINPSIISIQPEINLCNTVVASSLLIKNLYASYMNKISLSCVQNIMHISKRINVYEIRFFKDFSSLPMLKDLIDKHLH